MKKETPIAVLLLGYLLAVSSAANVILADRLYREKKVTAKLATEIFEWQAKASPAIEQHRQPLTRHEN